MHCTWFNENNNKKRLISPIFFLWVVSSPKHVPTSVALIVPACPSHHHLRKERHPHLSPPEGTSPGTLGPGPAGLQLLTSPRNPTAPTAPLSSTDRKGARGRAGTLFR